MGFLQSLPPDEVARYHRVASASLKIRNHFELMLWLQGDMQDYLPHDIMIAAWGDFHTQDVQFDIVSSLVGVRTRANDTQLIKPLLLELFARWVSFDFQPFTLSAGADGFAPLDGRRDCTVTQALQAMRCALVHGIKDQRDRHDCLYVALSVNVCSHRQCLAMAMALPYIDAALRQVTHLPHQLETLAPSPVVTMLLQDFDLSEREAEIMTWVAAGKTNPEIGQILDISGFTVKNHLQRIFKKLNVMNRAQAVSKINTFAARV